MNNQFITTTQKTREQTMKRGSIPGIFGESDDFDKDNLVSYGKQTKNVFHLWLIDEIGDARQFLKWYDILQNATEDDLVVIHVNCYGGNLFTAIQIITQIKTCQAQVVCQIESACCSAATMIALACDGMLCYPHGYMMIHTSSGISIGKQSDIKKLMDIWHGDRFERIYLVTLFTGMRQGEVLGLTWDCVDFKLGGIYVNKQLTKTQQVGGEYCLAPTKNSQSRFIFAAPTVMELLRQQILEQQGKPNEWNLVFTNETGGHLTHRTVYKGFKASVRALGLDGVRFHDLRHTFAVASLEAGDDIKTVQENLGHASAAFTMNVYAHVSQKMKQRSASNMERYIRETARAT